jgi:hypothetical protein
MPDPEAIEQKRQAIMRFRELLDILCMYLDKGEAAYAALFANLTPEQMAGLSEKEHQRLAAHEVLANPTPLGHALLDLRGEMHNLERDFEQVYDNVMVE